MKYINWSLLADDLLEVQVLNQIKLAELCNVTQQTVSNWKTGTRKPGVFARNTLIDLCKKAKLNIDDYKVTAYQKKRAKGVTESEAPISDELLEFAKRLATLPKKERSKIMDMAEFIIDKS